MTVRELLAQAPTTLEFGLRDQSGIVHGYVANAVNLDDGTDRAFFVVANLCELSPYNNARQGAEVLPSYNCMLCIASKPGPRR